MILLSGTPDTTSTLENSCCDVEVQRARAQAPGWHAASIARASVGWQDQIAQAKRPAVSSNVLPLPMVRPGHCGRSFFGCREQVATTCAIIAGRPAGVHLMTLLGDTRNRREGSCSSGLEACPELATKWQRDHAESCLEELHLLDGCRPSSCWGSRL